MPFRRKRSPLEHRQPKRLNQEKKKSLSHRQHHHQTTRSRKMITAQVLQSFQWTTRFQRSTGESRQLGLHLFLWRSPIPPHLTEIKTSGKRSPKDWKERKKRNRRKRKPRKRCDAQNVG